MSKPMDRHLLSQSKLSAAKVHHTIGHPVNQFRHLGSEEKLIQIAQHRQVQGRLLEGL